MAHIVKTRDDVDRLVNRALAEGANATEPPRERGWGGYSGYIRDLDGFYWEIAFMENPLPI
jgi:uncharacterized glyoxalase superfamily protein PhnB